MRITKSAPAFSMARESEMKTLNHHTEMTAHLRRKIAAEGIKARVRKWNNNGGIQVFTVAHNIEFTEAEQRYIRNLAKVNGLTSVRGLEIDVERMTDQHGMVFFTSRSSATDTRRRAASA